MACSEVSARTNAAGEEDVAELCGKILEKWDSFEVGELSEDIVDVYHRDDIVSMAQQAYTVVEERVEHFEDV